MKAAITSVYIVIAPWTPVTVVSRSATICEIETFITLESSTITNWAAARMTSGSQRRTGGVYGSVTRAGPVTVVEVVRVVGEPHAPAMRRRPAACRRS